MQDKKRSVGVTSPQQTVYCTCTSTGTVIILVCTGSTGTSIRAYTVVTSTITPQQTVYGVVLVQFLLVILVRSVLLSETTVTYGTVYSARADRLSTGACTSTCTVVRTKCRTKQALSVSLL